MIKKTILVLICVLVLSSISVDGFADSYKCKSYGKGKACLLKKCYKILKAEEELKLSKSQVEKIEAEIIDAKKKVIMDKAKIKVIALDIKMELKKGKINIKHINKLIDEKYDLKKSKTKTQVEAYAKIKNILNKTQKEQLCKVLKSKKKCEYKKSKEADGKCYIDESGNKVCPMK